MLDRYLIYRAWHCHLHGQPIPVTLFSDLVEEGIDPEDIEAAFVEGFEPPFDIFTDEELFGEDEEGHYLVVGGEQIYIDGIEPDELEDLLNQINNEENEEDE